MVEFRDPLLAFLLIGVPIGVYFLLTNITPSPLNSVLFFEILIASLAPLLILAILQNTDHALDIGPIELDDLGLDVYDVGLGLGLGFLTLIFNVVVVQFTIFPNSLTLTAGFLSSLYVPQFFSVSGTALFNVISNAALDIFLVAPGEEGLKASQSFGLYMIPELNSDFSEKIWGAISIIIAVAVWASYHTILAGFSWYEVVLAFVSGMIWVIGWIVSKSLLVPILSHALYDSLVVAMGLSQGAALGIVVTSVIFGIVFVSLRVVHKKD